MSRKTLMIFNRSSNRLTARLKDSKDYNRAIKKSQKQTD